MDLNLPRISVVSFSISGFYFKNTCFVLNQKYTIEARGCLNLI